MTSANPHDLARFIAAQAPVLPRVIGVLVGGGKNLQWLWFVFPQIAGLGHSETARFYAVASLAEARAYLAHPILGPRLVDATRALLQHAGRSAESILGGIDAVKLRASLTLFLLAGAGDPLAAALDQFFGGDREPATLRLAGRGLADRR